MEQKIARNSFSYPASSYISKSQIEDDAAPETDLEVEDLMNKSFSLRVVTAFMKIYNGRRLQGYSVLDAYMDTLQDYIRICKDTMPSSI